MEREQLYINIKQNLFEELKGWIVPGEEIYEP